MKKTWGEGMACVGCGYVFKPGEQASAGANYGPGPTQGPFYWCYKCCPPMNAADCAKMIDQFVKDVDSPKSDVL